MPFNYTNANTAHKNKYDYSNVIYKNIDTKVDISCPDHGKFSQTPYKHVNMKQGCPSCKGVNLATQRRMTTEDFCEKAKLVHGDLYDYSKVNISNAHTKITITCSVHGDFSQTPNNHLYTKNGCPHCGYNTSKTGNAWLDLVSTPSTIREHHLKIGETKFKLDGFDPMTNTVYEYFGNFWHGNPDTTDHTKINPRNKIMFKTLYENTLKRIQLLESAGFNVIYTWGP